MSFVWSGRLCKLMANLFQTLEETAARGAAGLTAEARETLAQALFALQNADGGFAGLDGRSDLYFSFFAWLSLRALGAPFDRERLCAFADAHVRRAQGVDAQCAEILLAREGRLRPRPGWLRVCAAAWRGETRAVYGAFLLALALGSVPRLAARLAWGRQREMFEADVTGSMPTPRLAAGLMLATWAGRGDAGIRSALLSRRRAGGGFASAAAADADLLATAAARFALGLGRDGKPEAGSPKRRDLAFVEACWLEDGLFGASPRALQGDAEHTFYALLALGTCRTDHS